jgi:hypothetical protein
VGSIINVGDTGNAGPSGSGVSLDAESVRARVDSVANDIHITNGDVGAANHKIKFSTHPSAANFQSIVAGRPYGALSAVESVKIYQMNLTRTHDRNAAASAARIALSERMGSPTEEHTSEYKGSTHSECNVVASVDLI